MLFCLEQLPEKNIEQGELLTVCAVSAANVVKDIHSNIRNLIGGKMEHYEKLIESTLDRALDKLSEKAKQKGYDGVVGVKITHPVVVDGGVEIVVYGNGFYYK